MIDSFFHSCLLGVAALDYLGNIVLVAGVSGRGAVEDAAKHSIILITLVLY